MDTTTQKILAHNDRFFLSWDELLEGIWAAGFAKGEVTDDELERLIHTGEITAHLSGPKRWRVVVDPEEKASFKRYFELGQNSAIESQ